MSDDEPTIYLPTLPDIPELTPVLEVLEHGRPLPMLVVCKGMLRGDREFHRLKVGANLAQSLMEISPDRWGGSQISIFRNMLAERNRVPHDEVPDIYIGPRDLYVLYAGPADPITASILAAAVLGVSAGLVGGIAVGLLVGAMVIAGTLVGMYMMQPPKVNMPETVSDAGSGRGTLGIPRNQARLGSRIPDIYGIMRTWPDLIAPVVDVYNGADFMMEITYCVGVGDYAKGEVRFGDSPISRFPGASLTWIEPHQVPFNHGILLVSDEAKGFSLPLNEWSAWVTLPGDHMTELWVDIVFNGGLIQYRTGGDAENQTVSFAAEYQFLDPNTGLPAGGVQTNTWSHTAQKSGTLRYTHRIFTGGSGNWRIRVRKTFVQGSVDNIHVHDCEVGRFATYRADVVQHKLFSTRRTYLRVHVESSRQTGPQSYENLNVVVNRVYAVLEGTNPPTTAAATQRWCDALYAMLNNPYLGGYPHVEIDVTALLRVQFAANEMDDGAGGRFCHIFDRFSDVDEQLQATAHAMRAAVVQDYGMVSIIRDEIKTDIAGLITPHNRTEDDQGGKTITFRTAEDPDCVQIEWFDRDYDFVKRMYQYPPSSPGELTNPRKVDVVGLNTWSQVYRRAVYEYRKQTRRRRTNVVTTFLEGMLFQPMDLIEIVEPWDGLRSSEIVAYVHNTGAAFSGYIDVKPSLDINPGDYMILSSPEGRMIDAVGISASTTVPVNRIFLERDFNFAPSITSLGMHGGLPGLPQAPSRVFVTSEAKHNINRWLVGTIKTSDGKCQLTLIEYDADIFDGDRYPLPFNPRPGED